MAIHCVVLDYFLVHRVVALVSRSTLTDSAIEPASNNTKVIDPTDDRVFAATEESLWYGTPMGSFDRIQEVPAPTMTETESGSLRIECRGPLMNFSGNTFLMLDTITRDDGISSRNYEGVKEQHPNEGQSKVGESSFSSFETWCSIEKIPCAISVCRVCFGHTIGFRIQALFTFISYFFS